MKLIRCYIENFGGLHQYTVDFDEGLTVIHEPNGFGKTTLAEFIRAMFYGFPRAGKDLSKNPRLKYLPWQGGRYGGYLIFRHGDKRYRIDRSFGDAPKGDKFKLFNEETHKEVKDFGADIGQALFGLDSDSFMRSTYMPQLRDTAPLTTDNIRAKLGNLLEDTGDLGSYEKALQKLKDKRSLYEHFRGNGGSIHEAQKKISALQQEIELCKSKQPLLSELTAELEATKQAQELGEGALQRVRRELSAATTAEAEAALCREYEGLCKSKADTAQALESLVARYPKGVPTWEALDTASKTLDKYTALEGQLAETPADRAAAETVAEQEARFSQGVPTHEEFTAYGRTLDRLMTAKTELQGNALSPAETQQLSQLEQQFAEGIPTEEVLGQCRSQVTELTGLRHSRSALELPTGDTLRLQGLEEYFAKGVPSAEDIQHQEQMLNRADEIRRENLQLSAIASSAEPTEAPPQKKFHSLFLPALIAGLLSAAAGIFLLVSPIMENHSLIGGICMGLGAVSLVAAAILQNNHSLMTKLQSQIPSGGMTAAQRSLIHENEQAIGVIESTVAAFLEDYPTTPNASLRSRLAELSANCAVYLPLRERRDHLAQQAAENDARTAALTEALHKALSPYFDTILDFHTALQTLELRAQQFAQLSHKQREIAARNEGLSAEIRDLEEKFSTFLRPYCGEVRDYRSALDTLRRDADSYTAAKNHLTQRAAALAKRDKELEALRKAHQDFCEAYGLTIPMGDRQQLKAVEREAEAMARLSGELEKAGKALAGFIADHGHKPVAQLKAADYDLDGLKIAEQELIAKQNTRRGQILQLEQRSRQLRGEIDRIPALTDELTRLTEQKAADTDSRRLLDCTADFLQKARESLSASYLGGVQGHFARYLTRLTKEEAAHISVNTDLEVQLERMGSARALPHFSAGQTDAVHLCMRLALADALFESGSCFMILDDPFVNLDDHHTARALALLKELSKNRQIIYLVCNSSRI